MKISRISSSEKHCNKVLAREKPYTLTLRVLIGAMVVSTLLSTTGCMGLLVRGNLGKSYSELKSSMVPVSPRSGRLFVYMVDGGPSPLNTMGVNKYFSADNQVYSILGKTYTYIDLQMGMHKVTVGGVMGFFGRTKYGENAIDFELKEGENKFCRINLAGISNTPTVTIVEPSVAEQELANIPYNKYNKEQRTIE